MSVLREPLKRLTYHQAICDVNQPPPFPLPPEAAGIISQAAKWIIYPFLTPQQGLWHGGTGAWEHHPGFC